MTIPTPENLAEITERVDNFIETLSAHFISGDAINTLAGEINAMLGGRQNGMNILALSVCLANVMSEMDREHRAIALAGVCKMVITMSEEEGEAP